MWFNSVVLSAPRNRQWPRHRLITSTAAKETPQNDTKILVLEVLKRSGAVLAAINAPLKVF